MKAVETQLGIASPSDVAVLLYSLAILGFRPSTTLVEAHGRAVRGLLPELGVRRISNLLWAHAKLGMRPTEDTLLGDMVSALHGSLHEANTRDLASSLWALATLGFLPQKSFLEAFGAQVCVGRFLERLRGTCCSCAGCTVYLCICGRACHAAEPAYSVELSMLVACVFLTPTPVACSLPAL
jgi:hypothetical protein